jgi:GNAT superfamily N-acetyltransferase
LVSPFFRQQQTEGKVDGFTCSMGTGVILSENASIYAGGMFGVITELYVVPAQRSAGVATKLVDAAATLGRKRSWGRIEVGALERSLKFYLSAGFVELGPRLHLLL